MFQTLGRHGESDGQVPAFMELRICGEDRPKQTNKQTKRDKKGKEGKERGTRKGKKDEGRMLNTRNKSDMDMPYISTY